MYALLISCVSIVVLGFVLWYQIYITKKTVALEKEVLDTKSVLKELNSDLEVLLSQPRYATSQAISILDLEEFQDLDEYLKFAYKRYIRELLAPAMMAAVNKTAADNDLKNQLDAKDIYVVLYRLAQNLKEKGLSALPGMAAVPVSSLQIHE